MTERGSVSFGRILSDTRPHPRAEGEGGGLVSGGGALLEADSGVWVLGGWMGQFHLDFQEVISEEAHFFFSVTLPEENKSQAPNKREAAPVADLAGVPSRFVRNSGNCTQTCPPCPSPNPALSHCRGSLSSPQSTAKARLQHSENS